MKDSDTETSLDDVNERARTACAYCLATVKVPLLPLSPLHVPVSRSLLKGATEVTMVPSQVRPVAV